MADDLPMPEPKYAPRPLAPGWTWADDASEEPPKPSLKASRPPVPAWMWILFGFVWSPLAVLIFSPEVDGVVSAVWGLLLGLPMLGGLALASSWYDGLLVRAFLAIVIALAGTAVVVGPILLYLSLGGL